MNKKAVSVLVSTLMLISIMTVVAITIVSFADSFAKNKLAGAATTTKKQLVCMQEVVVKLQDVCFIDDDNLKLYILSNGIRDIKGFKVRMYSKDKDAKVVDTEGLKQFLVKDLNIEWKGKAKDVVYAEAIPLIDLDNKETYCPDAKDVFGNAVSTVTIKPC
jgi:hypothetical protein